MEIVTHWICATTLQGGSSVFIPISQMRKLKDRMVMKLGLMIQAQMRPWFVIDGCAVRV